MKRKTCRGHITSASYFVRDGVRHPSNFEFLRFDPLSQVLLASSPNPFQSNAEIAYEIPKGEEKEVSLKVYDVMGRVVRVLVDERKGEGRYIDRWDGRDETSREMPPGIYFYRLSGEGMTKTKKVILLR